MPYTQLSGGAYESRSVIAAAQRCVNLYLEPTPKARVAGQWADEGEPSGYTHHLTPGLRLLTTLTPSLHIRCLYTASDGQLFVVADKTVYSINTKNWNAVGLGYLTPNVFGPPTVTGLTTPVSMADNGLDLMIVDDTSTAGHPNGWIVNLASHAMTYFTNTTAGKTGFLQASRVDFIDTFFVLSQAGKPNFYCSGSLATTFDPLDFAAKAGKNDAIVSIVVNHLVIWLLGVFTSEVFVNSGGVGNSGGLVNNTFPFERLPGVFYDRGCAAVHSVGKINNRFFFLSQDKGGFGIVMMGEGSALGRISNHAIENTIRNFKSVTDAVGFCYEMNGHEFYVLSFPTDDQTWVYDATTGIWHERVWMDPSGGEHRTRYAFGTVANGIVIVGDWENANLYALDQNVYTDAGAPIKRVRSFPHSIDNEGRRIAYKQFVANIQPGTSSTAGNNQLTLRWSDNKGVSFNNPIHRSMGELGQFLTSVSYRRLGMSRDRVWEISFATDSQTSFLGAFVSFELAET